MRRLINIIIYEKVKKAFIFNLLKVRVITIELIEYQDSNKQKREVVSMS